MKKKCHKYASFIIKEDDGCKKYGRRWGGTISKLDKKDKTVTIYGDDDKILYQGINGVDCEYKSFNIWVFLYFKIDKIQNYIKTKMHVFTYSHYRKIYNKK
jgi:hypothetical protein